MSLRAGVSRIDITPREDVDLCGFKARQGKSKGIHDKLYSSVLILDNNKEKVVILSNDIIGIDSDFVGQVRGLVEKEINIPGKNVMVTATHTHSGPFTAGNRRNESYLHLLKARMLDAVAIAEKNMQEAYIGVGNCRVEGVGLNRRDFRNGPTDPYLGSLLIKDRRDNILAILANYCCHPTVLGPDNLLISADYPGYLRKGIEKRWGKDIVVLFTNGACGDINPGHSAEISALGGYIPGRTFKRAKEIGEILAAKAVNMKITNLSNEVHLAVVSKTIKVSLRKFPSLDETEKILKEKQNALEGKKGKELERAQIDLLYAEILLAKVKERDAIKENYMEMEIQAIIIGDTVLLGLPVELFVEVGLSIKEKAPIKHAFVIGYANGLMEYIPTREAYRKGGYEVAVARFTPKTAKRIEKVSLDIITSLLTEAGSPPLSMPRKLYR